jgi:secreted PhoX family phosphatase
MVIRLLLNHQAFRSKATLCLIFIAYFLSSGVLMTHNFDDDICNQSNNEHFQSVLGKALENPSRRRLIQGGFGLAALSTMAMLPGCASISAAGRAKSASLGFGSIDKSVLDSVILPPGYSYKVLHAGGDPLNRSVTAYSNQGTETDDWSARIGDQHDGMDIYYVDAAGKYSDKDTGRAVLAVNHESSAEAHFLHPKGQTSNGVSGRKFDQFGRWDLGARPELEVLKEINLHGVSVVELSKTASGWSYKLDSPLNRRVTPQTPARITGPAAHMADIRAMMSTRFDPSGATSRGTLNNCGHGKTPWGTFLACEENWAMYFQIPVGANAGDAKTVASRRRYGVSSAALTSANKTERSQGWHTVSTSDNRFTRWNIATAGNSAAEDFRNEPNTFGYNFEIDPLAPNSVPAKRVAMGRFAHEAAVCSLPKQGAPLAFYMGDDSRNDYIYKFVSTANWDAKDIGGGMAAGDKYLSEGKLYVAKFNADGKGQWLELTITDPRIANHTAYRFANQADVLINARHAADALGATPMDRPEWGAVNYQNGEIYFALTNNNASNRTPTKVNAANPRAYMDVDGKKGAGNPNGHIIRFKEDGQSATAMGFAWDIFVFGAEEDAGDANLSGLTAKNAFSSPDGLWFSKATGICWIQTDDGAMTDETNCMLLAAVPGQVGDGGKVTVNNAMTVSGAQVSGKQETFIGAALGETRLRRFLVSPKGGEVTGITETEDGKTLFVNIQHPGENTPALGNAAQYNLESTWPGNAGYGPVGRPRSATLVITRNDGGLIGV